MAFGNTFPLKVCVCGWVQGWGLIMEGAFIILVIPLLRVVLIMYNTGPYAELGKLFQNHAVFHQKLSIFLYWVYTPNFGLKSRIFWTVEPLKFAPPFPKISVWACNITSFFQNCDFQPKFKPGRISLQLNYCKNQTNSDTKKHCCNHPWNWTKKHCCNHPWNWTMWFSHKGCRGND